jgi:hypothetical protein
VLTEAGVSESPEKVKAEENYPVPKSVKDFRAFLGLASFYRRLVPGFVEVAKPLTELTRKDRQFIWSHSQRKSFEELKAR